MFEAVELDFHALSTETVQGVEMRSAQPQSQFWKRSRQSWKSGGKRYFKYRGEERTDRC